MSKVYYEVSSYVVSGLDGETGRSSNYSYQSEEKALERYKKLLDDGFLDCSLRKILSAYEFPWDED